VTASLPQDVQEVFDRFITTEYTTVDGAGQPITWPVTPYYRPGDPCISITTGLGYPKKANDARGEPRVGLLFSDPTGSDLDAPAMVLVQGIADVDDRDLRANRERYERESAEKLPGARDLLPPAPVRRLAEFYFTRVYVHVRPERVFVWRGGLEEEPELFDSHLEEVRSGHAEEPPAPHAPPEGGEPAWDERVQQLGSLYPTAVLSLVSPDGFPFSVRVPVSAEPAERRVRILEEPLGLPLQPGRACVTGHDHAPSFTWQRNFQVRGDLSEDADGWSLQPHRIVGGFELPPVGRLAQMRLNARKFLRFRRIARNELKKRAAR
jgi:hypothetical protein